VNLKENKDQLFFSFRLNNLVGKEQEMHVMTILEHACKQAYEQEKVKLRLLSSVLPKRL
jgi:hypothetical protein